MDAGNVNQPIAYEPFSIVPDPQHEVRSHIYTAILTAFAMLLKHPHVQEQDPITFIDAFVTPDDLDGVVIDDNKIMRLFTMDEYGQDEPLFYQLFLQEAYISSHFEPNQKIKISNILRHNLLPVSQGDGNGTTLLHLALNKKNFAVVFHLLNKFKASCEKKNIHGQTPFDILTANFSHVNHKFIANQYTFCLRSALPISGIPKEKKLYVSKDRNSRQLMCKLKTLNGTIINERLNIILGNNQTLACMEDLKPFKTPILEELTEKGFIFINLRQELLNAQEGNPSPIEICSHFSQKVIAVLENTIDKFKQVNPKWHFSSFMDKVNVSLEILNLLRIKLLSTASCFTDANLMEIVKKAIDNRLGCRENFDPNYRQVSEQSTWVIGDFEYNEALLKAWKWLLAARNATELPFLMRINILRRVQFDYYESLSFSPFLEVMRSNLLETASLCKDHRIGFLESEIIRANNVAEEFSREKLQLVEENTVLRTANTGLQQDNTRFQERNTTLEQENVINQERNIALEEENREIQERNTDLEEENREIQERNTDLEEENRRMQERHIDFEEENREIQERNTDLEEENREIQERHIDLEEENREIQARNIGFEEENREIQARNIGLEGENREIQARNIGLEEENREIQARNIGLEEENRRMQAMNTTLAQEQVRYTAKYEELEKKYRVLNAILEKANDDEVPTLNVEKQTVDDAKYFTRFFVETKKEEPEDEDIYIPSLEKLTANKH